jgi:hypothetical protein
VGPFRAPHESTSPLGHKRNVGEWALHIQCPWRFCEDERILLGSRDIYYNDVGDPLDDWDSPGKSQFDTIVARVCEEFAEVPPHVTSIVTDDFGGFSAQLTNDFRLQVFPHSGQTHHEFWRLFQPGTEQDHFVFRESL